MKELTLNGYNVSSVEELYGQLAWLLDEPFRDDGQLSDLPALLDGKKDILIVWEHADVSRMILEEKTEDGRSEFDALCDEIRRTDDGHEIALVLLEGTRLPAYTFDYHNLSSIYDVENIDESHYEEIYSLYTENKDWFEYQNAEVTMESIHREALASDGVTRFFVAFREPELVGIANVILEYPRMDTVWIDSFMIRKDLQGFSYGSEILRDMLDAFTDCGFIWVQTGVPEGFPAAEKFWRRNWFADLHKRSEKDGVTIKHMIRGLQ